MSSNASVFGLPAPLGGTNPETKTTAAKTNDATAAEAAPAQTAKKGLNLARLDWPVIIGMGILHLGALAAPFVNFGWSNLVVFLVFAWLSGNIGITLAFHRLLTHRSYKTPKWFEYFITLCGTLAWQGSPMQWVGTHRIHHKHSDEEHDPHSPTHGFTWSHIFWTWNKEPEGQCALDAAKDLQRDPVHRVINRFHLVPQFVLAAGLFAVGQWVWPMLGYEAMGLSWVVWGVCLRTICVWHGTWFVNSASHTWGYRNYETKDNSTNLWWVAIVSFGEGWHNNHHAHQRSARHGLRWFEFDLTWWTIKTLEKVGLAKDPVLPKDEELPH